MTILKNNYGAIAVITAIMLSMFLGFVALSIDTGHLVTTKNELQNAADAGALAGARELYSPDGTTIQTGIIYKDGTMDVIATKGCNEIAYNTAISNFSDKNAVEVNWTDGNTGDVVRGHWSYGRGDTVAKGFYPNDSIAPVTLWGVSDEDLDDNLNFINAVQVTARRDATPIVSFFAKLFGYDNFKQSATAVAYIGFAGSFDKYDFDQPIAICYESLTSKDAEGNTVFNCNIGRMINSSTDPDTSNTGGWTDFEMNAGCNGINSSDLIDIMTCDDLSGNQDVVEKSYLETGGGQVQSVYTALQNCWISKTGKIIPWTIKLPVVLCPGNNVGNCSELVGAVTVEVVWITGPGEDPGYNEAPTQMADWSDSSVDGEVRWTSFVNYFGLQNVDGSDAPYSKKSIYFKPSCEVAVPNGGTGGFNLGVLAEIPVLVD